MRPKASDDGKTCVGGGLHLQQLQPLVGWLAGVVELTHDKDQRLATVHSAESDLVETSSPE